MVILPFRFGCIEGIFICFIRHCNYYMIIDNYKFLPILLNLSTVLLNFPFLKNHFILASKYSRRAIQLNYTNLKSIKTFLRDIAKQLENHLNHLHRKSEENHHNGQFFEPLPYCSWMAHDSEILINPFNTVFSLVKYNFILFQYGGLVWFYSTKGVRLTTWIS